MPSQPKRDLRKIIWVISPTRTKWDIKSYHGYYPADKFIRENGTKIEGVAALCHGRLSILDDNRIPVPMKEIENDGLNEEKVCKACLMVYNSLKNKKLILDKINE